MKHFILSKKTKFWLGYHFVILIFSAVIAMIRKYRQTGDPLDPTVTVPFLSIFIMSVCIGYLALFLVNKVEGQTHQELKKKVVPGLLIFYIASFLIANLAVTIGTLGFYLYHRIELDNFWTNLFRYELIYSNSRFLTWLMFFTIAFFYILWNKSVKREQMLMEEKLRFQYSNLKSQVNPHFLFNTLNTISELVYQDVKQADHFIQQLSGIYRYILENENNELITLDKEIDFVKRYFDLQQVRDADKILLEIDLHEADQWMIIPVSLQGLVENAIKHNSCSKNSPLKIKITRENECVVVSNNIQRKNIMENSTRIGLNNLKKRVNHIMNKELVYIEEKNEFNVKIPVMQLQT